MMGERPQSGDGLVLPEAFPCKSENINVENIKSASSKLKSMGQVVDSRMDTIVGLWNGLPGVYVAPEAEQAYGLMKPAAEASETIKTKFEKAAGALGDFADAIEPVKGELEALEQEAASFRTSTLSEYGDKWRDHQEVVDRNNELLSRYARVVETLTTAAASCANTINGLLDGVELPKVEGVSADALMQSGEMMPWGAPVEKNRNCGESVVHGVGNFAKNTWDGFKAMAGFAPDGSWSWENFGNAWVGVGDFALSVWVVKNPVFAAGVTLLGGRDGAQWVADRYKVVAKAVSGMVGFDLEAHLDGGDGFHKWKKDGVVSSVTESVLNIASARIPGAGPIKGVIGGTKLGAAALATLNLATRAADYALPGGGWLIRGGVKVVDLGLEQIQKLRSKTSVDLTDTAAPGPVKPGPLTPSGHTPSGHGGTPPHTTTSSGSSGGVGVSKSSGPGPDFLPPRNPGGARLNPLHGLNLDANNPTTGTSTSTSTGTSNGSGAGTTGSSGAGHGSTNSGSQQPHSSTTSTGNSTGATSTGSSSSHASTGSGTGTGNTTGSGSGNGTGTTSTGTGSSHASTGSGSSAGNTGSSGTHNSSGSQQPHINTGSSSSTSTGSGTGTGSGSAVGSGSGHNNTGHGSSAGSGGAGHSGANSGASQQPHVNTSSSPRPDPLIEKPRPHHTPEDNPTTNNNGNTESPTSGKNPEHPHPKDLSTPTTRNNNGDTPHTHHDQETAAPSSRGNPHGHGGDSTPTDNHNPPHPSTEPNHPTDPDHPTNPEHPQRQGQESSSGDVKHPTSSDDHREGPDQPASGGNQQPRKVPGALYDENGRPLHDKDGKPLEVDHGDGKRHYASDPADTYRDSQNALQNNEGGYSKDPYTGWDKDVDAFNDREPSTNHPWEDPTHDDNYRTDRQKRTDLDTTAREKAETAKTTFNDLKSYGMKPEGKSFRRLADELDEISHEIDPKQLRRVNEVRVLLRKAATASEEASRASEWLGERAAAHRNKDLGRGTIIGDPPDNPRDFTRTGPGKVDTAAIEGDTTFVVDEAKSGDSPNYSSRRTENGVRAQQGTLEYITDLLTGKNQDPRILESLTRLKQEGKHPKFFENLAAGKVELNYELIQARTNGNVAASNFRIAPPGGKIMLTWDGKGDLKITIVPKGK